MTQPQGWRIYEHGAQAVLEDVGPRDLESGEIRVKVEYSSINYKDALALTGSGRIARTLPLTPGIDFSGEVTESAFSEIPVGTGVFGTGLGVGEQTNGGLAEEIVVAGDSVQKLPDQSSTRDAMELGTAGFTALLCVEALEQNTDKREVIVTGSSGGVGSIAVALLARRGWEVTAVSSAESRYDGLRALGATNVVDRDAVAEERTFSREKWTNAIDCVGGAPLAGLLATMSYGGVVAACGNAAGMSLNTSVLPFILRGVRLIGIDSVYVPVSQRESLWANLLSEYSDTAYRDSWVTEVSLTDALPRAEEMLSGGTFGRTLVRVNG